MKVFLAEKPEVAKHIAHVLDSKPVAKKGYYECGDSRLVTWCIGHLLALSDPEDFDVKYAKWNLDHLPMTWPIKYKPTDKKTQLNIVVGLLKKATIIISCVDIDASGQAIADEIFEEYNIPNHKVLRALIDDNNPKVIAKSLQDSNLKPNSEFRKLYLQEKSRAVGDQRVGYNITRLLTCQAQKQGYKQTLHAGRVQSSILGLVVRRERGRSLHVPQKYYNVQAECVSSAGGLKGRLDHTAHAMLQCDEKNRLSNPNQVNLLVKSLHNQSAVLRDLEKKRTQDSPPLPFDLLSLQSECARYYGFEPSDVLDITQKLREAPYYAITYNRSDSRYLKEESFSDAPKIIDSISAIPEFKALTDMTEPSIKSRAFNSSKTTAHGGIIPTGCINGWDTMPDECKAVYLLIARNYLIQFLPKRERYIANYRIEVTNKDNIPYSFLGRVQVVEKPGWAIVFRNDAESEEMELEDIVSANIDSLQDGMPLGLASVESTEMVTNALPSYIMSTLLNDLKSAAKYIEDEKLKKWMLEKDKDKEGEHGGIGTAATRSEILKGLFENKLLEKNKRGKIVPTQKGLMLYDLLPKSITSPDTTAIWSHYFKMIGDGEATPEQFLFEVDNFIESTVLSVKRSGLNIPQEMLMGAQRASNADGAKSNVTSSNTQEHQIIDSCPKCKGLITRKKGNYGFYWDCPTCKSSFDDLSGKPLYRFCSCCSKQLKIRRPKGRKPFLGCSGYPECNQTEEL